LPPHPTKPANYKGSYTAEYRVIIAGIQKKGVSNQEMAMKLSTTLSHISTVPNPINSNTITEFYNYMKSIGTSKNYQNQNLKAIIVHAKFLDDEIIFLDIRDCYIRKLNSFESNE
jgi:hypothetical protein